MAVINARSCSHVLGELASTLEIISASYPVRNVERLHYVHAIETLEGPASWPRGFSVIPVEGWSWVGSSESSHVLPVL